jgi:hypothetical protein
VGSSKEVVRVYADGPWSVPRLPKVFETLQESLEQISAVYWPISKRLSITVCWTLLWDFKDVGHSSKTPRILFFFRYKRFSSVTSMKSSSDKKIYALELNNLGFLYEFYIIKTISCV